MKRLRVALAGAGMVSAFHLPAWRALGDRIELVAIADPVRDRAAARATEFGMARSYGSLDEMLDRERPDAVDLLTPPAAHAANCASAADAGAAILCQKPLAPSYREALRAAAVQREVRLMVHENWRFRPHYRHLKRWLDEGRLGMVTLACLHVRSSGLLPDAAGRLPALERQPLLARLPRMMIAEVLVHHLDIVRWLFGTVSLKAVTLRRDVAQIAGESQATLELVGADGAAIELHGDMTDPAAGATLTDEVRIEGSQGVATLRGGRLRLQVGKENVEIEVDLEADYRASYAGAIGHFVDALTGSLPFEATVDDHLRVLRLVDDAYLRADAAS